MQIDVRSVGDVQILELQGRITFGRGPEQVKSAVRKAVDGGVLKVILDLRGVEFLDSTGIETLVWANSLLVKHGGLLKLLNVRPQIHHLLSITNLLTVLDVYAEEDQALASFSAPPADSG